MMAFQFPDFYIILPEIFVLVMTCIILLTSLFGEKPEKAVYILSQVTLIGAMLVTWHLYHQPVTSTFNGSVISDPLAHLLKLSIYIISFFAFLYSHYYVNQRNMQHNEFYVLSLFSILGMMVLVSAQDFLVLYLGLELLSLPLYALVALRREMVVSAEASMKYFVMGAIASAMLLYGISMLYGFTGNIHLSSVAQTIVSISAEQSNLIPLFGLVFIVVGLAFKLGGAPFHMWVPDVYQGAPTPVVAFLSSASKIAAFGMAIRLLAEVMPSLQPHWQPLFILMALLSIGIGNIAAIAQLNIKRLLAYSSIAHIGYMFLGLIAGTPEGYAAAMFYIIVYAIMALGAFGVIVLMSREGLEAENITDYKGLNSRNPWLAFMMLLIMFSMTGIPPTVGFFAKMGVLSAVVNIDMVWLAVVALLFSVIGAFYYLRIIKIMYFDKPEHTESIRLSSDLQFAISINGLAIVGLGVFAAPLFQLCQSAFFIT